MLVARKKLKSSANRNEKAMMPRAFMKVSFISSAVRSLRKSRISEFSVIWRAKQVLSGCTEQARGCLLGRVLGLV